MDVADEIKGLYREYWRAERSGNSEAIASLYTTDARLIPPRTGTFNWAGKNTAVL